MKKKIVDDLPFAAFAYADAESWSPKTIKDVQAWLREQTKKLPKETKQYTKGFKVKYFNY